MKKVVIYIFLTLLLLFFLINKTPQDNVDISNVYPWQIEILNDGRTRVFGIIFNESKLDEISDRFKAEPIVALYESTKKSSLEAYYKNISFGGLIGSFILTLNATKEQLDEIKNESHKKQKTKNNEVKYKLDKFSTAKAKKISVKNLIYIPRVQLDEETIKKRFGKPTHKIKLKTKEIGWHYLYPEKGLDLIYKKEGKEVLQYVLPKDFNLLLEPLLTP